MEAIGAMKRLSLFAACLLVLAGTAFGQSIMLDHVTGLHGPDTILVGQPITFYIRIQGDTNFYHGIANGFRIYSPDGATWGSTVGDTLPLHWYQWFGLIFSINSFSIDGAGADTIGFGGSYNPLNSSGLPPGFDSVTYTMTIGPIDPSFHGKTIVLDSSFYRPIGRWKWAGPDAFPSWGGPYSFTIFDPNAPPEPSNLVLSTDSLAFTVVQGGSVASQTFDITSDRDPLNFSIVENSSWLVPTPILGTTPRTINAAINTIGLLAGTYLDSMEVTSTTAGNSPQWVKVSLVVTPPPPIISVSPASFVFNAIASGSNPADKILTIKNIGQSTLNWSVSNSQSWLSLSPTSGTDSGDVTLSVDITGLGFGDYYDTIVVSDPNATNSPKRVPVSLSVASDLPIIAVDSSFNYIIVPGGASTIPPRNIHIYNSGAGSFNFTLSEHSPRILSLTPNAGTAPGDVSVGFKISSGGVGDYFDTVFVTSAEATNSPYPVVFQFHFVQNPALLSVSPHTLNLNVYECDQGYNKPMTENYINIQNNGGDVGVSMKLLHDTTYFRTDIDSGLLPQFVTVTAKQLRLPLGTYVDTILVTSKKAANSPQVVVVNYNVIPGSQTPEISLVSDHYNIPTQENEGPLKPIVYQIYNRYGGCMEWNVQENIPWFYPDPDSGQVPSILDLDVNAVGIPFGQYQDSFFVVAPSASNSPKKVTLTLQVWRFHGDVNYDGEINIADVIYLLDYQFNHGPAPQPELRVGDMQCNLIVDISDLIYLVDYSFSGGPIPCGNPY